jgi:hypothetical protein
MIHVTVPGSQDQAATLEWEVLDLLLSDERLVQEMFEDIVTAEWPPYPVAPIRNPPGTPGGTAGTEMPEPPAPSAALTQRCRLHCPRTDGWGRERSPPNLRHRGSTVCRKPMEVMPSRDTTAPE